MTTLLEYIFFIYSGANKAYVPPSFMKEVDSQAEEVCI